MVLKSAKIPRPPPGWLIRHPRDRLPAALISGMFAIQCVLFAADIAPGWALAGMLLLLPALLTANAIVHNHYHTPTFRWAPLNRIYEAILFFQTNLPPYGWQLNHNLGHHRNWHNQDPSSPTVDEYRWLEPEGRITPRLRYTLRTLIGGYRVILRNGQRYPAIYARFKLAFVLLHLLLAGLLIARPLPALIAFVLPMAVLSFFMTWYSYSHHVGLRTRDPYAAAYTNPGRLSNLIAFNTGYHTAHHISPGVHWSDLPAFHASIADRIPAHCYHDGTPPDRALLEERIRAEPGDLRGSPENHR